MISTLADAISAIFELVKFSNIHAADAHSQRFFAALREELVTLCDILGIIVEKEEEILDEDIEKLIAERQAARKVEKLCKSRRDPG